ncbi:MAG: hypothetical protein KKD25_18350 [Gammaproteobacteria bacterium]|nr:hypothetical protein [Gammaproteobacteria bacterium]MBU0771414.1 hypothetical protein [Gammaproteobacteria bacterium]MBU0857070.1 hypothetical protein [Gammaproteobacteria bacterium]MBU1847948.1 hypothetical protein [Gammaproteobacteria bacterium]
MNQATASSASEAPAGRPLHPFIVLAVAVLLPGMGQVLNGMMQRAWIMLFFGASLAVVTFHLTTPEHSFVGRHAGGFFIYAVAVIDAYVWARYRHTMALARTRAA